MWDQWRNVWVSIDVVDCPMQQEQEYDWFVLLCCFVIKNDNKLDAHGFATGTRGVHKIRKNRFINQDVMLFNLYWYHVKWAIVILELVWEGEGNQIMNPVRLGWRWQ